jgi:hypothetical protein
LLGIWGCNNKSVSMPSKDTNNDTEIDNKETESLGQLLDTEPGANNLADVKLTASQDAEEFLFLYFPNGKYVLLEEPLNVNFRNIYFAVHYINEDLKICDVVIGFENDNGAFRVYLLIKDFCFTNEDGSMLFDFSKDYKGIYGFNISYSYPKVSGYTPGLNIDTYFDNGNRVADTFTIMWNEENKIFERVRWF